VRKSHLFELIAAIKSVAPGEMPVIVGSQAVHLITDFLPEIVRQSIECDFLITGGKTEMRAEINKKLGVFSRFQIEHGFYADALGLATVVLPAGWQDRLQNLEDENGNVVAKAAEIYDIAVSKLIAGREKDFVFLNELILREYILIEPFLERAELIKSMPQSDVLIPRFETLANISPNAVSIKIKNFVAKLKAE
jgi:hypothetical protein